MRVWTGILLMLLLCTMGGCGGGDGRETVPIGGRTFHLELAIDDESRTRGLMGRESLAEDEGMLFIFPRSRVRSFWMANCLIDIDIIFVDPQGRVTAMHAMKAEPPKAETESQQEYEARMSHYWSSFPAQFAIELQAGMLERLELAVEDKLDLDLARLKRLARDDAG